MYNPLHFPRHTGILFLILCLGFGILDFGFPPAASAQNRTLVVCDAQDLLPSVVYYFPACTSGDSTGSTLASGWITSNNSVTEQKLALGILGVTTTGSVNSCSLAVRVIYGMDGSAVHYKIPGDTCVVFNGQFQHTAAADSSKLCLVPWRPHDKRRYQVMVYDTLKYTLTEKETLISFPD